MNKELIIESIDLLEKASFNNRDTYQERNELVNRLKEQINKPTLKQYIIDNYGSQLAFSNEVGVSPALCNYWVNKPWNGLTNTTKSKILTLLGVYVDFE